VGKSRSRRKQTSQPVLDHDAHSPLYHCSRFQVLYPRSYPELPAAFATLSIYKDAWIAGWATLLHVKRTLQTIHALSVGQHAMLNVIKPLLALLFVSHVILAQQTPLVSPIHSGIQRLSSVAVEEHTILSHAAFPKHRVRVTRVEGFCDTTVAYVLYR
jgi:hypothetical protein